MSVESTDSSDEGAAYHFVVSFWGAPFREYFLRLSAGSLLAPGNAPSLVNKRDSRMVVCTTVEDWQAIQEDPTFVALKEYVAADFIELRRSVPEFVKPHILEQRRRRGESHPTSPEEWGEISVVPTDVLSADAYAELEAIGRDISNELTVHSHYALRIHFMATGHKAAAIAAHEARACAVFLAPDMMLSDGAILALEAYRRAKAKVVLIPALRFRQDECLDEMRALGLLSPGQPLAIKPRELVSLAFRHPHPETECFEFESDYFCDTATSATWRVAGDDGVLLHSFHFGPLLIDYRDLEIHHTEYFDQGGTTDGKYIAMHFPNEEDIVVIDDSDEALMASFTPGWEYYYPVKTSIAKRLPLVGRRYKTHLIRKTLFGPMGDPVKRRYYVRPMRLHSGPLGAEWDRAERKARGIAHAAARPPGLFDHGLAMLQAFSAWIRGLSFDRQGVRKEIRRVKQPLRSVGGPVFRFLSSRMSPERRASLRSLIKRVVRV